MLFGYAHVDLLPALRARVGNDPGGPECVAAVTPKAEHAVILAADDCPGECIFIEVDR